MNVVEIRRWTARAAIARRGGFVVGLLALGLAAGCHSGAPNPFQTGATRVPPPPTRNANSTSPYYNGPTGAGTTVPGAPPPPPGAPGAIGTGIPGSASNWSSNPNAVAAANGQGVYTSYLERTPNGYTMRSAPSGTVPAGGTTGTSTATTNPYPPTPPANTRSSVDGDPRYPSTPLDGDSAVQPASFQQPVYTGSASGSSRYGDAAPYVPPTPSSLPPPPTTTPPASSGDLMWRAPRP